MIRIVDYRLGNVLAFQNVYKRLNVEAAIARTGVDPIPWTGYHAA